MGNSKLWTEKMLLVFSHRTLHFRGPIHSEINGIKRGSLISGLEG